VSQQNHILILKKLTLIVKIYVKPNKAINGDTSAVALSTTLKTSDTGPTQTEIAAPAVKNVDAE
jgi:hypothetical protein